MFGQLGIPDQPILYKPQLVPVRKRPILLLNNLFNDLQVFQRSSNYIRFLRE